MNQLKPYIFVFFISIALLLMACGQTGDLYLPEGEPEKTVEEKSKK